MLIKNGCRGKSCYFVGCTRMDCEEGWKEAMDPRGGINQIAAVEEDGDILDGLKRKRKSN